MTKLNLTEAQKAEIKRHFTNFLHTPNGENITVTHEFFNLTDYLIKIRAVLKILGISAYSISNNTPLTNYEISEYFMNVTDTVELLTTMIDKLDEPIELLEKIRE